MSNNEMSCVAQSPGPRSIDRRGFLRRVAMGVGASALALAAVKPALADTIINRNYVSVNGEKLAKTATCVVGKSGAVDYYTEDYASDNLAIQAAVNYVDGLGGGSVLIEEGSYTIEAPITIANDYVFVMGVGSGTILQRKASTNVYEIIRITGDHCSVSNMQIDGNEINNRGAYTEGHGIYIQGGNDNTIQNVYSHDCYRDPFVISWAYGTTYALRNKIINCIAENSYNDHLIYLSGASDTLIIGCTCKGYWTNEAIKVSEDYDGASLSRVSERNIIDSCHLTRATTNPQGAQAYGINFVSYSTTPQTSVGNMLTNSIIDTSGVGIVESRISLPYSVISNNVFIQSWIQTHYSASADSEHTTIRNNIIKILNSSTSTILGISIISDYCKISNNQIYGENTSTGSIRLIGTSETITGLDISNNYLEQIGSGGITGIQLGGASPSLVDSNIANNVLVDVSTNFVNFVPAVISTGNQIINNIGYNPIGNFTAPSIPATTVNYTNNYGYPCQVLISGGTVTEIDLDDIATGLTSGMFVIAPGETINITYSSAPTWKWWGL